MEGFRIKTMTEKGEEILLRDINGNKKIFKINTIRQKPFLEIEFLIKGFLKKAYELVPGDQVTKGIKEVMTNLGGVEGVDFEIEVIE